MHIIQFIKKHQEKTNKLTSSDERLYIDLKRSKDHTGEIERINRNDSDLKITIESENALTKKLG